MVKHLQCFKRKSGSPRWIKELLMCPGVTKEPHKVNIPSARLACDTGGQDQRGEKSSQFLVMPLFVGPRTQKWHPASICIKLPTFPTILNTENGGKSVWKYRHSYHCIIQLSVPTLITTDKLKTFGISKDNSTKCLHCNSQQTQLGYFLLL